MDILFKSAALFLSLSTHGLGYHQFDSPRPRLDALDIDNKEYIQWIDSGGGDGGNCVHFSTTLISVVSSVSGGRITS